VLDTMNDTRIRIFEHASFPDSNVVDRNRYEVAKRLPRKFEVCAFGDGSTLENSVKTICPRNRFDTVKKILAFNPDIFHSRCRSRSLIIRQFIRLRNPRCKHVFTLHGMPERWAHKWGKIMSKEADVVTCVSNDTARQAREQYHINCKVIPEGTNINIFKPKKHHNERLQILFVGRYVHYKHPDYVVEMAKRFPQCDFVLYGEGPLRKALTIEASKLKNVKVNRHMPYEKMPSVYIRSDIFLFPSVFEGFGMVVLEALACGLPVVCFNRASLPYIVQHGKSGLLANNLREMKEHLGYLIEDGDARRRFSKGARERALEFDCDIIAQKWAKLFEQVAG